MAKRRKHKHKSRTVAPDNLKNTYKESSSNQSDLPLLILNNSKPDLGYAVNIPDYDAMDSETWNMVLTNPANQNIYLWVEEINIDFSMSGSYGQSRYRNQFFPRSFNQPVLSVSGTAPNQFQYNLLANFIREAHFQSLKYSSTSKTDGRTYGAGQYPLPTVRVALKDAGKENPINQSNVKGGHNGLIFEGYLQSISAGATKFNFAPSFSFDVILASSTMTGNVGIYEDTLWAGDKVTSWMTLFKENQFGAKNWKQIEDANAAASNAESKAGSPSTKQSLGPANTNHLTPVDTIRTGVSSNPFSDPFSNLGN